MDARQLTISSPSLRDNGFVPKHYIQYLKYQNEKITFQSTLFYSNGPKLGINKSFQLLTNLNNDTRDMLSQVENFAINNLILPPPIAEKWQEHAIASGDTLPFKRLYQGPNLFLKMAHDIQLFNMDDFQNGQYQSFANPPPLGPGMYIVLFEVPAVYIGSHNSNPKVASLQVRIVQIVYRPKVTGQCRIVPYLDTLKSCDMDDALDHVMDVATSNETDQKDSALKSVRKKSKKSSKKSNDNVQTVIDSVVTSS